MTNVLHITSAESLDRALVPTSGIVNTSLNHLQHQRGMRVEGHIVGLIVFEIALSMYDFFTRALTTDRPPWLGGGRGAQFALLVSCCGGMHRRHRDDPDAVPRRPDCSRPALILDNGVVTEEFYDVCLC